MMKAPITGKQYRSEQGHPEVAYSGEEACDGAGASPLDTTDARRT